MKGRPDPLTPYGGRKFLLCVVALPVFLGLAKMEAPGEAYMALAIVIAGYSASNAAIKRVAIHKLSKGEPLEEDEETA